MSQASINSWTYKNKEEALSIFSDLSIPWTQVNLEGFDPVFYWRGAYNYAVIDDSLVEYHGLLYAGTDNPDNGPEIWAYNGDGSTNWTKVSDKLSGYSFLYGGEATQFLIVFQRLPVCRYRIWAECPCQKKVDNSGEPIIR